MLFHYAPDRKAERPAAHLARFRGDLHADAYAGFDRFYGERIAEVACWAHVRRKFYDVHVATGSATAREALDHIAGLYAVEQAMRGKPPDERQRERERHALQPGGLVPTHVLDKNFAQILPLFEVSS